jgi:hypothetical protein
MPYHMLELEDSALRSHRCENLKSKFSFLFRAFLAILCKKVISAGRIAQLIYHGYYIQRGEGYIVCLTSLLFLFSYGSLFSLCYTEYRTGRQCFAHTQLSLKTRDSSVDIAMGWTVGVQFPVGVQIGSCGPNRPTIQWVPGDLSPRLKRPVLEAGHSPPSNAEVKYGRAIRPLPISLHGAVLI